MYREIVEEERYVRERDRLFADVARADEALEALMWALGRDAEALGTSTAHPAILATRTYDWPHGGKPLILYYTIEGSTVRLLSIRLAEPKDGGE